VDVRGWSWGFWLGDIDVDWNGIEIGLNNLPGGTPNTVTTAQAVGVLAGRDILGGINVVLIQLLKRAEEVCLIGLLGTEVSHVRSEDFINTNPAEILLLFIKSVVIWGEILRNGGEDLDAFGQKGSLGTGLLAPGVLGLVVAVSGGGLPCQARDRAT